MKNFFQKYTAILMIAIFSLSVMLQGSENMTSSVEYNSTDEKIDSHIILVSDDIYKIYDEGEKFYKEGKYSKAIENYKKSCDLKYGIACLDVAAMYSNGTRVKKNRKKASEYYGKACDYGYAGGCKNWNILNGYAPEM